jgi:hypothetical protein
LTDSLPGGWRREKNKEKEVSRSLAGMPTYAFYVPGRDERPAAYIFMMLSNNSLKISNIVPATPGNLSRAEYNALLEQFSKVCSPIVAALNLRMQVTSDQQNVPDLLKSQKPSTHFRNQQTRTRVRHIRATLNDGSTF